jgi:hypothetical protein
MNVFIIEYVAVVTVNRLRIETPLVAPLFCHSFLLGRWSSFSSRSTSFPKAPSHKKTFF